MFLKSRNWKLNDLSDLEHRMKHKHVLRVQQRGRRTGNDAAPFHPAATPGNFCCLFLVALVFTLRFPVYLGTMESRYTTSVLQETHNSQCSATEHERRLALAPQAAPANSNENNVGHALIVYEIDDSTDVGVFESMKSLPNSEHVAWLFALFEFPAAAPAARGLPDVVAVESASAAATPSSVALTPKYLSSDTGSSVISSEVPIKTPSAITRTEARAVPSAVPNTDHANYSTQVGYPLPVHTKDKLSLQTYESTTSLFAIVQQYGMWWLAVFAILVTSTCNESTTSLLAVVEQYGVWWYAVFAILVITCILHQFVRDKDYIPGNDDDDFVAEDDEFDFESTEADEVQDIIEEQDLDYNPMHDDGPFEDVAFEFDVPLEQEEAQSLLDCANSQIVGIY